MVGAASPVSLDMWLFATWTGRILTGLLLLVLVAGGVVGFAYASDEAVDADVVSKQCGLFGPNTVKVRTRLMGLEYEAKVDYPTCHGLPGTAFIQYHVRSGRTVVYEREGGRCLFDTAHTIC